MKSLKDYKEVMKYTSCVDTQSHLKKCGMCKELAKEREIGKPIQKAIRNLTNYAKKQLERKI